MQNLGEVFKELRKSRNVSLQEATGGEFTYSMLSKFERGEADLSSMKLITALDNIHSDLNEFMYLVRGFSQKKALAFQENLWELYDREGIDSLHALYEETIQKYRSSGEKSYLLQMIRIKSLLVFFDSEIRATDEELTFLYDYFFTIDIWGNYELELFSTISTLFPLPLYFKYSREMLQKTDLLGSLPSNKVGIDTILINGLFKAIEEKDKLKADYFVFQIEKRDLPESQAYLKIIYMIAKGYYDTIFKVENKGLEKIQRGITILQDLEYIDGARYYENYFVNQLSNKDL
ncbi:transcriptional activator Rgg/GadR/MutR family protein [Streptococcus pneumoniae]|uniref:helix-turn-helix domain-containing protein n=3 Tax=Streptococcus pneumoniae TaxID=1313 RepID=UPI0005DBE98C|nr:Rgg/GadR/MutR family transcriptional regulator [Streptococcus pneumoniae]CIW47299.1 transcriptional activator Rgg/GadR/MutR family protein [Streptococcus pneumoniae]CIX09763.1 transcriptional activator Rgg/GadR/MutR family protein [Streptococcus pneumoniae]CJJ31763.1 transcriptional activator Rgg/GadR/MutR family protein [Streptococcus pneumoniae]CJP38982.1 transcriptional activator Rgg/GadR/MutR family protein [Streptococcus pneumoniae]CJS03368.1 transcriptional activator Rgg/GadR/MutR fam